MNDTPDTTPRRARSLESTIRQVRTAETERSDVVVEMRDAERGRLEILAEELRSVFDEVPADAEQFIFTVAAGWPPRLWIDMTSFVVMGRDRRTYRFLKDTRLGRTIILETPDLSDMADTVTHYVAERIIERERAIEGEWLLRRIERDETERRRDAREAVAAAVRTSETRTRDARASDTVATPDLMEAGHTTRTASTGWVVAAFVAGLLAGMVALLGFAWFTV